MTDTNNLVPIIYTCGYGAGWSTWNDEIDPCDRELASVIDSDASLEEVIELASKKYPEAFVDGLKNAVVRWVEPGTQFKIVEYDGWENITFAKDQVWKVAK